MCHFLDESDLTNEMNFATGGFAKGGKTAGNSNI